MRELFKIGLAGICAVLLLSSAQAAENSASLESSPVVWMSLESDDPDFARDFYSRLFYWPAHRPQRPITSYSGSDYAKKGLFLQQHSLLIDPWEPSFRASFYQQDDSGKGQSIWVPWLQQKELASLENSLRDAGYWTLSSPKDHSWMWQQGHNRVVALSTKLPALRGFHGTKGPVPRGAFLPVTGADLLASNWVAALRVSNLDGTIRRAKRLGGSLVSQSSQSALLKDPTGALFSLQVLPARN
ncbi:VOC family protein [Rhodovibrionaceae bacterium A322]